MMASSPSAALVENAKKAQKENEELQGRVTALGNLVKRYQGMMGRVLQKVPKEMVPEFEKMLKAVHTSNGPTLETKEPPVPAKPKGGVAKREKDHEETEE